MKNLSTGNENLELPTTQSNKGIYPLWIAGFHKDQISYPKVVNYYQLHAEQTQHSYLAKKFHRYN
jgi:hypothetical protein